MEPQDSNFDAAVEAHDREIQKRKLDIWVGAEPTFTNRLSQNPEWLSDALGKTKCGYALGVLRRLKQQHANALILRTLGRQYANEDYPRWNLGLYQRRDGQPLAIGLPADPLISEHTATAQTLTDFWHQLQPLLDSEGWHARSFELQQPMGMRILLRIDQQPFDTDSQRDPRLGRPSIQDHPVPISGAEDDLASEGFYLVTLGMLADKQEPLRFHPCIEIPAFATVALFMDFLQRVAQAAQHSGLQSLIWRGFPPPVDEHIAWTTITPDPAVVEVNQAPASCVSEFLQSNRQLFALAAEESLAPYRLQYTGQISDSGGGGQFTLGGPDPLRSPFFKAPQLLPRLIRYLNNHPVLSYWFAPSYLGSYSQSPRADENVRESLSELGLALYHLSRVEHPEPEFIWRSLSPFLVDTSGNAHRSELNIEKLWNPYLPGRGCLGLVEFRAFRMSHDAESMTSIALLLRSIVAMLSERDVRPELVDWGSRLHDRFSLPFYLRQDLDQVLQELDDAGLHPGAAVTQRIGDDSSRLLGQIEFSGVRLEVSQALEFWPLLGDAATHTGGSRLVDASTSRLQVTLRATANPDAATDLRDWILMAASYRLSLRAEQLDNETVYVKGVRYRSFEPFAGLHPGIGAQGPIVLYLIGPAAETGLRITLHEWQPQRLPYDGLPVSVEQAKQRIYERFVVEQIRRAEFPPALAPPAGAQTDYCLDLRRC